VAGKQPGSSDKDFFGPTCQVNDLQAIAPFSSPELFIQPAGSSLRRGIFSIVDLGIVAAWTAFCPVRNSLAGKPERRPR
jgi:hypothetical protein